MGSFAAAQGREVIEELVRSIQENTAALSEIDGAIGDGDHGINMNKGFTLCAQRLAGSSYDLAAGFSTLGTVLLTEIGGAMGPLYGTFFRELAKPAKGQERIDGALFERMLAQATDAVAAIGGAHVGDKSLLDVLVPSLEALKGSRAAGKPFAEALAAMSETAERSKEGTREMVARIGRASRLGERSRGVLDAGATSCALLLRAMATAIRRLLSRSDYSDYKRSI
ncbi:MAG TPA: dihydroxyacetone kinase subunit DhaL [Spirochaetia bacterium]|nr:dihydroxyacetone kinase subunit DhaL [Spirochaetia bacterium]